MVFSNSKEQPEFECTKSKLSPTAEGAMLGTVTGGVLSPGADPSLGVELPQPGSRPQPGSGPPLSRGSPGHGCAGALSHATVFSSSETRKCKNIANIEQPWRGEGNHTRARSPLQKTDSLFLLAAVLTPWPSHFYTQVQASSTCRLVTKPVGCTATATSATFYRHCSDLIVSGILLLTLNTGKRHGNNK